MSEVLETENQARPVPRGSHFVAMGLLPAVAVSAPYAYLLWDESNHYDVPFWGMDLIILLGAPFAGYGISSLAVWFLRERIRNRRTFYWAGVSVLGSFTALAIVLAYFYWIGSLHYGWKKTSLNILLFAGGLSIYTSAFNAAYFYAVVSRALKRATVLKAKP